MRKAWIKLRQRLRAIGKDNRAVFDDLYRKGGWKGPGEISSGLGSLPENSRAYEDLLVKYIADHAITSLADIGCGDHQVAHRILERAGGKVRYTGLDVSSVAIAHNEKKYASDMVSFRCADASRDDLPKADLVIVREVLQHISNADVARVLAKLRTFPHVLVTNTVAKNAKVYNVDIAPGSASRAAIGSGLLLDLPPFSCRVEELQRTSHRDHPTEIVTVRLLSD